MKMSRIKSKKKELVDVDESEISKNFEYSVKMMRWLLQIAGMWPQTSPIYSSFLRSIVIAAMCFLLAIFMITVGLHSFIIVKDFKARIRNIGPLSFGLMSVIKFAIMIRRKKDIGECLDWLSCDWRKTKIRLESDLMLASATTGVTFTTICVSFMMIGGMSYSSFFSFIQERTIVNNVSLRPFAYPGYFVFVDPYDHFYKIYAIQSMCGFAMFSTAAAVASIAIAFTMHVCGQISVIYHMIHNLTSGTFDKEIFRHIVQKHLRALRLAKKLEDLLNGVCLVEMMGCCFNICITGYCIITEFKFNNPGSYTFILLMISFIFNIFIFCYVGEQLSEKCNNIRNIAYDGDWYDLSLADTRKILMIITSTHHPVVLTAGKLAILSMPTFSNVLKASMSYLNMLRALTTT